MLRIIKSKKGVALLAGLAVLGVAAAGSFAYFTTGSSGSGTAKVGSLGASGVQIHLAVTIADGLIPGAGAAVAFAATNDSTTTDGYVGAITLAPNAVTDVSASPNAGCVAYLATTAGQADFTLNPVSVSENTSIPPNDVSTPLTGATLKWASSATQDQTGCVGEKLQVAVAST